jgi:ACS family pantothenate transporter-like MFS transporter
MATKLQENVARKDVEGRVAASAVENGQDVSTIKRSWKSYFWDSWDKTPEERRLILKASRLTPYILWEFKVADRSH